jgi:small subunit ribosomal protein S13
MADAKEGKTDKRGEQGPKASAPQQQAPRAQVSSIVRISGKDVYGSLSIGRAIRMIKGIGSNLAFVLSDVIESKLGVPETTNIGSLTEDQVLRLEQIIKTPSQYGIPSRMLNRNKDMETGSAAAHNVSNDLLFATRQDINRDISLKDYKGFRHQYGQKVRGQHTRSTGRTGATVGVTKKAVREAQKASRAGAAPAAAGAAAKEEKPKAGAAEPKK